MEAHASRFRAVYPTLETFCRQTLGWETCPMELLWQLWLPLATQLVSWHQQINQSGVEQRPLVQGILGGQGTGKTTLAAILRQVLQHWDLQLCQISIDDLYKSYADRLYLQQQDPRFRWRGPPGTHDVQLGLSVLQQLRNRQFPVTVPRFDKSAWQGMGDRTTPETILYADIVLFEGWFVGVQPIEPAAFETAPPPINTAADRDFARKVNANLAAYLPLWALLDRLLILKPTDYRFSQQWRKQAEQRLTASGRSAMLDAKIEQFVEYFWRSLHPELFISPLLPEADLVIEIDVDHQPIAVYHPLS
ncbi:glycerate kinase [Phormidium tenue FACHB-886]|nr:glycerate kinase [Phormidium tenue FACHB-886]